MTSDRDSCEDRLGKILTHDARLVVDGEPTTVRTDLQHIFAKPDVSTRTAAVARLSATDGVSGGGRPRA